MRILHYYPNFLGGGGVANSVRRLAEAQALLGAHVAIAAAEAKGEALYGAIRPKSEVELIVWGPRSEVRFRRLRARVPSAGVARVVAKFEPDIVHIHGEYNVENLFVPRLCRAPLVLSFHGAAHPVVLAKSSRLAKRAYIAVARRLLYGRVSRFHALSPAEREHIERLLPGADVYTVPQGPNLELGGEEREIAARGGGVNDEAVTFAFVGRLDVFTKGLDLLVQAFGAASEVLRPTPSRLVVIGPDWNGGAEQIRSLAGRLGCLDRVELTGIRTGAELRGTLDRADVYVQLSRHEGFGLALMEALILGKPSIVSAAVGAASWAEVRTAPYVRVVEPEVGIAATAMVDFARRRKELADVARRHCHVLREFFCWDRVAKEHLAEYERIREEPRSGE